LPGEVKPVEIDNVEIAASFLLFTYSPTHAPFFPTHHPYPDPHLHLQYQSRFPYQLNAITDTGVQLILAGPGSGSLSGRYPLTGCRKQLSQVVKSERLQGKWGYTPVCRPEKIPGRLAVKHVLNPGEIFLYISNVNSRSLKPVNIEEQISGLSKSYPHKKN
jgi:hypothetical protein